MRKESTNKKIPTTIKNPDLVEKRQEKIFQDASKLFMKKGYHNTTMRGISKETGIGLGSLYDYIGSKEDILYLVHEKAIRMITEDMAEETYEALDPVRKLKRIIVKELELMDKYQDLILCLYQESHALSKPSLKALLESETARSRMLEKIIEEAIEQGMLKPMNPVMLSNMIKMTIDSWVLRRWALRGKVSLEEMKQGVLEMIFKGILNKEKGKKDR